MGVAEVRTFGSKTARTAIADRAKSLALGLPEGFEDFARELAEGIELGAYRFTRYLTGDRAPKVTLTTVTIHGAALDKKAIAAGQAVADGINLARDLSNEPPNTLTPLALAAEASKVGKKFGMKTTIIGYKELVRKGMALIDAVGRGSVNEPCLGHIAYIPSGSKKNGKTKKLVFVGKGITFDSGGICIKPAAGMGEMKHDMSGAANVVGLMADRRRAQAERRGARHLRRGREHAGRQRLSPRRRVGFARRQDGRDRQHGRGRAPRSSPTRSRMRASSSPTSSSTTRRSRARCVVALGTTCSGWYACERRRPPKSSRTPSKSRGEQMWRMPLLEELKDQLKSDVADIKHTGDR